MEATTVSTTMDEGLRSFMIGVYNRMIGALMLTAGCAWMAAHEPLRHMLFTIKASAKTGKMEPDFTILGLIVAFAPIAIILLMGLSGSSATRRGSSFVLWSIAALFGLSLGSLVMAGTGQNLAETFVLTAGSFGAMSLFGYTTKFNLNGIGNFLIFCLFGLILLSIFSIFTAAAGAQVLICVLGLVIFAGLIAYDTQKMKEFYFETTDGSEAREVMMNHSALQLYLDFINVFLFIYRLLNNKSS